MRLLTGALPGSPKTIGFGGAERDRTADLVIANDALSQLSYSPFTGKGPLAPTHGQGNGLASWPFDPKTMAHESPCFGAEQTKRNP